MMIMMMMLMMMMITHHADVHFDKSRSLDAQNAADISHFIERQHEAAHFGILIVSIITGFTGLAFRSF